MLFYICSSLLYSPTTLFPTLTYPHSILLNTVNYHSPFYLCTKPQYHLLYSIYSKHNPIYYIGVSWHSSPFISLLSQILTYHYYPRLTLHLHMTSYLSHPPWQPTFTWPLTSHTHLNSPPLHDLLPLTPTLTSHIHMTSYLSYLL